MADIKALLAAKKAKAEAEAAALANAAPSFESVHHKVVAAQKEVASINTDLDKALETKPVVQSLPDPIKMEEPAIAAPKAMTFAEKMAAKKAAESAKPLEEALVPIPVLEGTGPAIEQKPVITVATTTKTELTDAEKADALRTGTIDPRLDAHPVLVVNIEPTKEKEKASPEAEQAYADVKSKLAVLTDLSGEPLEGAMKELKKSLLANPAAVALMEDTDIAQMVIALRKITGEGIAEASKEGTKKGTKKSKQVDLSDAAAVSALLEEL